MYYRIEYIERFIKDECANYDKHYRACLGDNTCEALDGQRCGYFEKAVLGPPDYKYRLPGYEYQKLFAQYAQLTGSKKQQVKQRRCECGAPLKFRHRFCDDCAQKRAKKASRARQSKFRFQ